MNNITIPLIISFIAGFGTVLGSLLAFIPKFKKDAYISLFLTFSAIIMIYISISDLIPTSIRYIYNNYQFPNSIISIIIPFVIGYIIVYILNNRIEEGSNLKKISIISFIALILHNFPEGIATMMTLMFDRQIGYHLALSILFHNIPEGIILSIPISNVTHSSLKGVGVSTIAALSEPLGALLCYLFFKNYINKLFLSLVLLFVAGLMISLSINNIYKFLLNSNNKKFILYGIILSFIYIYIINII